MYTLFIDTHDAKVVIILFKDGHIINQEEVLSKSKHSELAMPLIDKVITASHIDIKDLNEIIIVNGPGSFTGERIAVTIGKTIAYCLNIPIRTIDALTIQAINIKKDNKIVAIEEKNGAYIGEFNEKNQKLKEFQYLNKTLYEDYKNKISTPNNINYELVYNFVNKFPQLNPHEVKPLYIKGISALNDK